MPQDEFRAEMPATAPRPGAVGAPPEQASSRAPSPNEALARRMHAAFHRGDLAALGQELADDVEWHVPGRTILSGDHQGRDAVLAFLRRAVEATAGTLHVDLLAAFGDDNYAAAWLRSTGTREGRRLDMKEAIVFAICDGRVTEAWQRPDPAQFEAFFA